MDTSNALASAAYAKQQAHCLDSLRQLLEEITGLVGMPYKDASDKFKELKKTGREAIKSCAKDIKKIFDDVCAKIAKLIKDTKNTSCDKDKLQGQAKQIYKEALQHIIA